MVVFKVSKNTEVNKLASAIFQSLNNVEMLQLRCLGVQSLNQAIKGYITAKGMAEPMGMVLSIDPFFGSTFIDGNERTLICLNVSRIMKGDM